MYIELRYLWTEHSISPPAYRCMHPGVQDVHISLCLYGGAVHTRSHTYLPSTPVPPPQQSPAPSAPHHRPIPPPRPQERVLPWACSPHGAGAAATQAGQRRGAGAQAGEQLRVVSLAGVQHPLASPRPPPPATRWGGRERRMQQGPRAAPAAPAWAAGRAARGLPSRAPRRRPSLRSRATAGGSGAVVRGSVGGSAGSRRVGLAVQTTLSTLLQQSVSKRTGGEGCAAGGALRICSPSCCRVCCPGCYRSRGRWKTTASEGPAGDALGSQDHAHGARRGLQLPAARSRAVLTASTPPPRCYKPQRAGCATQLQKA